MTRSDLMCRIICEVCKADMGEGKRGNWSCNVKGIEALIGGSLKEDRVARVLNEKGIGVWSLLNVALTKLYVLTEWRSTTRTKSGICDGVDLGVPKWDHPGSSV